MLHFTCDLCGKELHEEDARFVVKIEAYAAHDPAEITEQDLDEDHMEAVAELLREMEENDGEVDLTDPHKTFRYDLCPCCHKKFLNDPLGREQVQKLNFSQN